MKEDMTPILIKDLGRLNKTKAKKSVHWGIYQCQYCLKEWETRVSDVKWER